MWPSFFLYEPVALNWNGGQIDPQYIPFKLTEPPLYTVKGWTWNLYNQRRYVHKICTKRMSTKADGPVFLL